METVRLIFQSMGVIFFGILVFIFACLVYWLISEKKDFKKRTKYWDNWRNKNRLTLDTNTVSETENKTDSLTLEKVKDIISFPKDSGLYKSLVGICDVWFLMEKEKGATDDKALIVVLEKLGEKIRSLR